MAMTSPGEERLQMLRDRLLRLHAALLDRERRAWEATHGPVTSGQFLQLLIHDDAFAWLRPLSGIIAAIEAALDEDERPTLSGCFAPVRSARSRPSTRPRSRSRPTS